ncbi:c6 transcription factor protein [Lasallia pustulata]|uniref:C6 transcription factor protein n=1 Tax=Lasallia pustulata TaxID=136370 RepID=A0A1W5D2Z2_9LECA|nr:c6 transcription factor protein [Lasallia pustulata]
MGSTAPRPPSAAYSDAYVTADVMLHDQPKPPNVGINDKYMTSGSRRPHLDHSLQSAQLHYQTTHGAAVPLSPYPDLGVPYQNHTREHGHGFESSIDGRVESPQDVKSAFDRRVQASFSGMPGGRGSSASAKGRPSSLGSAAYGAYHRRNGSMDDTETTSPASSRGYGARQSDETIPLAHNTGMEEGMGEDLMNRDDKEKPPPWSELKTKAGKERKRLPLACIACRRKKIRCSGEKPACQHCLRSRIPCVYKVTTRKAAPRTDYMAMLDKRLKRMEERVIKIIPKEEISSMAAIGRANVKPSPPSQHVKVNSAKKRQAEEAFGPEIDDWAQSGVNTAGAIISQPPKGLETDENRLLSEGAESLPSKEIQEHLSETFFDYVYGQTYHVLHKPSFMRRLRAGSVPPVLLLAVCAVAARFSTHPQVSTEPAFLRGECWAAPARDIALRRYDEPNITILTVLLILGLHEFGTCQGGRSWMLGGMAMRMAYALQLHRELDHDPLGHKSGKDAELSFTDREIRRRTMWACFLMDRFNSSGTERPTFANEENIKVQLPIKESHFQMDIPGVTENLDGAVPNAVSPDGEQASNPQENMGVAAFMIRIIAIWGRVIKYLNLGGKERDPYPMWDINSHFAQLKRQIESFKESLPSSLQYTSENLKSHAAEKIANQFLFLHISYNQVLLFMYRFVIPCTPGGRLPKEMPKQFVNEAGPTAIEAANQISYLLNESYDHSVVAPFTGYCAFMSSTIHVWGIFSKRPKLEASSKRNLAHNVKYLSKMKKHWGMFHFMAENLKDIYRQHADAALRGPITPGTGTQDAGIFQYGDWFNKYPHGVSGTDYEDPAAEIKKESGNDAALSQKSDLQSVEEFFTSLSRHDRFLQDENLINLN